MKSLLILLVAPLFLFATELIFKVDGKEVKVFNASQIKSGLLKGESSFVGTYDLTLFNAWRRYHRTYRGYDFYELLDSVFGKDWRSYKKIQFKSLDGYEQSVRIKNMLKSSKGKSGLLAYTESGKKGFTPYYKKNKVIDPAPYYLVWSHFSNEDKATHGDNLKWPYQLIQIELKSK